jgi:hypothetical protein
LNRINLQLMRAQVEALQIQISRCLCRNAIGNRQSKIGNDSSDFWP